jgi:hypothetical protein
MSNNLQTVYNVFYEPETGFVIMQWRGYATSEQFREGSEIMLNTLIANRTNKVLADIQDMLVIGMDDQEWLQKHFIPRAINYGFKAIAIVKPKSYFNKVAVEAVSYKVDVAKLTINFFDSVDEARAWLALF